MAKTVKVIMKQRSDSASNWESTNPVLLAGEIGYDTTNGRFKIGDGTSTWSQLSYSALTSIEIENLITSAVETAIFEGDTISGGNASSTFDD